MEMIGIPQQLIVDVTTDCMLRCTHCYRSKHNDAGTMLKTDLFMKVIDDISMSSFQPEHIRITASGEPLLHPDIYAMIEYAIDKTNAKISLTTNGMLLNPNIAGTGLHMADISIDAASGVVYDKIRRGGDYNRVTHNVNRLIDRVKKTGSRTKVYVSFVSQPANRHQEALFRATWGRADGVIIRRMHTCKGEMPGDKPQVSRYPCYYPFERMVLTVSGHYTYCPLLCWGDKSHVIDARKTTLHQAWTGSYMNRVRGAHIRQVFDDAPECADCPDWQQTRWPWQGDSYMDIIDRI
jgi:organic radical activating enzyme